MGSAIALRENCPLVPMTPNVPNELRSEIRDYAERLDVTSRLHAYGAAVQIVDTSAEHADYYLLELDATEMRVNVIGYKQSELERASNEYLSVEKTIQKNPGADAVLVSADSMSSLKRAYPNYFLDTHRFVESVGQALE